MRCNPVQGIDHMEQILEREANVFKLCIRMLRSHVHMTDGDCEDKLVVTG